MLTCVPVENLGVVKLSVKTNDQTGHMQRFVLVFIVHIWNDSEDL